MFLLIKKQWQNNVFLFYNCIFNTIYTLKKTIIIKLERMEIKNQKGLIVIFSFRHVVQAFQAFLK